MVTVLNNDGIFIEQCYPFKDEACLFCIRTWCLLHSKHRPPHRGVCVISDLHHEVDEICTFWVITQWVVIFTDVRDNLLVPSSRVKLPLPPTVVPIVRPKMSVRSYHYWLCNKPEERSSHSPSQLRKSDLLILYEAKVVTLRSIHNTQMQCEHHI